MSIAAMNSALEFVERICGDLCNAEYNPCEARDIADTLRAAIEAAERQEPVAMCICCANGNDLPEGEWCRACDRSTESKLARAVRLARGSNEPPSSPVVFTTPQPAPAWHGVGRLYGWAWSVLLRRRSADESEPHRNARVLRAEGDEMNRNYADVCNAILDVCNLIGEPLNEAQRIAIAGAMTIWLKKERTDALNEAATICEGIAGCSYAGQAPTLRDVAKAIRNRP